MVDMDAFIAYSGSILIGIRDNSMPLNKSEVVHVDVEIRHLVQFAGYVAGMDLTQSVKL